jgi:hypothetical protein
MQTATTPAMLSPPTPAHSGYTSNFNWNAHQSIPPLEEDDTVNVNIDDISNEQLEEIMMNATQEFWASFPGEVGVGY